MLKNIYKNKKVLITGHTGFKGSWLLYWLQMLGANVVGISKDIPTEPSMFKLLNLESNINHHIHDLRDLSTTSQIISDEKPDFLFHLAAQPIVSESYSNPIETVTSNAIGTLNILESLRQIDKPLNAVFITSDKSYDNVEWEWGYKETDSLGGKDIYSGSKAAAEVIIKSYYESYFANKDHNVRIAVGRAGNVIGGGDWAKDRIIVDIINSWNANTPVEIRCPKATRPWQHVLEPLSGYLTLGASLYESYDNSGESFNFGPKHLKNHTVIEILDSMTKYWKGKVPDPAYSIIANNDFNEASLLKLNCDKALASLSWHAALNYDQTIAFTAEWYSEQNINSKSLKDVTSFQLMEYYKIARKQDLPWASDNICEDD